MKVKIVKEQARVHRTLFVFDFDDTLAHTDSVVVLQRDNQAIELDSGAFASYEHQPGDQLDFSDFGRVEGSLIANTLAILSDIQNKDKDAVIITARPPQAIEGIQKFFADNNMSSPPIYATAGSANKPQVMKELLKTNRYSHVVVYEDCMDNIQVLGDAVRSMGVSYSALCINKDTTIQKIYQESNIKLTKQQLTKIIREELKVILNEVNYEKERSKLCC